MKRCLQAVVKTLAFHAVLVVLSIVMTHHLAAPAARAADLAIRGGWVFDTASESFVRNRAVVIRDGRFERIVTGDEDPGQLPDSAIELDDDSYILPGLIDLHAHHNVNLFGRRRRDEVQVNPVVYLANGVTVAFPAGEYNPEDMLELRQRIEQGDQVGPRLINSGPYFGSVRPGWKRTKPIEEIYHEVDHWARLGVGGFKAKGIGPEHLQALIERAHLRGLTVTAHLDSGYRGSVNPRDAILMGIDRVEHFLGGDLLPDDKSAYASLVNVTPDTPGFQEIVQLYIDHGVYFDATISAYGYFGNRTEGYDYWVDERQFFTPYVQQHVKERSARRPVEMFDKIFWVKHKTTKAFFDAGGTITLGTDHYSSGEYLPGFGVHRELDALVASGIPPAAAIKIATINGARALKIDDLHGSIEPGKSGDLCIIRGNPLESIRHTRNVYLVVKAGQPFRTAELLESVRGKLGPTNEEEAKQW